MTVFSQLDQGPRPAPRVVELPPSAFSDDWPRKPTEPMRVGLRLVGEGDIERARAFAFRDALDMIPEPGPDRIDHFNDAVMGAVVARATCMPEDTRESFFEMPEDDVKAALTPQAIAKLFHEYDVLKLESCKYLDEASDEELVELSAMLCDEHAWGALTVERAKRLKRILKHSLEELDPEVRG